MHSVEGITQRPGSVTAVDHPLVAIRLTVLRDKITPRHLFRTNLQELSILLLLEAARTWETKPIEIETPLGRVRGKVSAQGAFAPEYDDCKLIAQRTGTPLQLVFAIAQESYFKNPK